MDEQPPPDRPPRPGASTRADPADRADRADRVVLVGTALWAVALLLVVLVPAWHEGARGWWPWACLSGLVLGVVGYVYLRRGREQD